MNLEEEKRIINLCRSDKSFFATIFDNYVQDVYRYSFSMTNKKETAEDAVSFAFLTALENIDKFTFNQKSIKLWILTIARNYIYAQYYKQSSTIDEQVLQIVDESENILENIIDEENQNLVLQVFASLHKQDQEIIRLKIWEELSFEEIAIIISQSLSSAKMRYYRAIEKLKLKLQISS
jgi:RNA polymerase sigma-70 factor, ECF subfamily